MATPSAAGALSGHVVLRIAHFCARRGHDPEALCERVGLSVASLMEAESRVPFALVERLGMMALEITQDEDFGLHLAADVERTETIDLGLLALMASPDVASALELFVEKQRFWGDGDRASLHRLPEGLAVRYQLSGATGDYARHAHECAMAEMVLGLRLLTGAALNPELARFAHPQPRKLTEHERVFGCPLQFATPHTELVLSEGVLRTPMKHANEVFLGIFEQQLDAALARLPAPAASSALVRQVARSALAGGKCTLSDTARALGLSPRTLQRRLSDEGTSFANVVDELRRELAVAYLQRGIPIVDVALLLGYADATAFHHAFRRWTGQSPMELARALG